MKITNIEIFEGELSFRDAAFVYRPIIVAIKSDSCLVGWGEMCPLSPDYDPAFSGWREVFEIICPAIVGHDPRNTIRIAHVADSLIKNHPAPKSALDMACWDIMAKSCGLPLCEFFGGRTDDAVEAFVPIRIDDLEGHIYATELVREGYTSIQVKVGDSPYADAERIAEIRAAVGPEIELVADANTAYSLADACRFVASVDDRRLTVEQLCSSMEEHSVLRTRCTYPILLDESIDSIRSVCRAQELGAADAVTVKLSRVGGLTNARVIRDAAVALGLQVRIEDMGGSEITTAAAIHLSAGTPSNLRLQTTDAPRRVKGSLATGLQPPVAGSFYPPSSGGLGVEPRIDLLGEPFLTFE